MELIHLSKLTLLAFGAGVTQSQLNPSLASQRCACDGGDPFPTEYYFCESLIQEDNPGTKYDNVNHSSTMKYFAWDEAGCSSSGDCCSSWTVHISYDIYLILQTFKSVLYSVTLIPLACQLPTLQLN